MSIHLPATALQNFDSDSQSSSSADDDQNWDDWISDAERRQCKSLFENVVFPSVAEAIENDKSKYNFDLEAVCSKLSLDFHSRVRLINFIRKEGPSPQWLASLSGTESFWSDDSYLRPVIEDDPLLQIYSNDWTDSEDDIHHPSTSGAEYATERRLCRLEEKLANARQDLADYRKLIEGQFNLTNVAKEIKSSQPSKDPKEAARDDDSHYFRSYAENDIHAVMIKDAVRTSTYAAFILSNPALFRGATVLDVGCGTGILSLFAAQAGASRVFAVDASDIAEKAKTIVQANKLEHVITVIQGKVENIKLPDDIVHVDIIVSEWMGYALLYESMLDSVLFARDRFLRPGGVLVPSQCKMMFGLVDAVEIFKERVGFWSDVYGFDLSVMGDGVYDDAIVDIVGPDALVSNTVQIKDLSLGTLTPQTLNFSSFFKLTATRRALKVHAFILYFDTFFVPSGAPVPKDAQVQLLKDDEPVVADVWRLPSKSKRKDSAEARGKELSFSTGPLSTPTHWKHTLFLLREPIKVDEGTVVSGTFHCRKSDDNSRELHVEIHYGVGEDENIAPRETTVQIFFVR